MGSESSPRRSPTRRYAMAVALSSAIHLLFAAGSFRWNATAVAFNELTEVELVPIPPSPTVRAPDPPPVTGDEGHSRSVAPQLASVLEKRRVAPTVRETPAPIDRPLRHEPEVTLEPSELPRIPTPREAARRLAVSDLPPAPGDRERVEERVLAITRGALRPLLNDKSPLPELRPDGRGNLVHTDGALIAIIAPDGTVSFNRRRGVAVEGFGDTSPDPDEQAILDLHTRLPGVPINVREASVIDCARGECEDKSGLGITFRPRLDLTDAVLMAKGEDPLAARKRRFLRLTKELREELALSHRKLVLSRSKIRMSRNLERLWVDSELSFATKRRLIFQLWDESEEPTDEADGENPERAAGGQARDFVLSFVRKRLPAGGAEAYDVDELRRLNDERSSQEPFSPYR